MTRRLNYNRLDLRSQAYRKQNTLGLIDQREPQQGLESHKTQGIFDDTEIFQRVARKEDAIRLLLELRKLGFPWELISALTSYKTPTLMRWMQTGYSSTPAYPTIEGFTELEAAHKCLKSLHRLPRSLHAQLRAQLNRISLGVSEQIDPSILQKIRDKFIALGLLPVMRGKAAQSRQQKRDLLLEIRAKRRARAERRKTQK